MSSKHTFKATLQWHAKSQAELDTNPKASKNHLVKIEGKSDLNISAAKAFKGDANLINPEDLLLSSLVSCHMMSYLYCCAQAKIEVCSYTDQAEAILDLQPDGSGRISKVILNPKVVIADPKQLEQALRLHSEANKLCFIANSCNFPVEHQASCTAEG